MLKRFKTILSIVLAAVLLFSCAASISAEENFQKLSSYEAAKHKDTLARLIVQISMTYYYGAEDVDLLYRALCSTIENGYYDFDKAVEEVIDFLKVKDKYSEFYSPERYENVYTGITGEYYGIGVTITLSGDHVVVAGVFPNSPAEISGIQTYDTIVSVDGTSIAGLSVSDVATLIKREKGQKVSIGIIRNGTPMTIDCFCDEVDQNPVTYEIMEGNIGYIFISSFAMNLDEFIAPILKEFEEKGIKDIILDIRNNGGGELSAAIKLAEHFIPEGTIAKLKYKDEAQNTDITIDNDMAASPYNMVLLVNENSASASELFAGAVKDRNAGTIIGTNTYGKGSMQSVYKLFTGAGIKYTVAEFYSPNDSRIHTIGVQPDYLVENSVSVINEEDFSPVVLEKNNDTTEGEHILAIEQRLEALGCFEGVPDSVFDEETREALKYFQMARTLEITGQPDVYTLVALNDIIYDFTTENDDQIVAAKNYLLTGKIN